MTRLEFVADRIRHRHFHDRHLAPPIPWAFLQPSEQHRWLNLALAALDADSAWHPIHWERPANQRPVNP